MALAVVVLAAVVDELSCCPSIHSNSHYLSYCDGIERVRGNSDSPCHGMNCNDCCYYRVVYCSRVCYSDGDGRGDEDDGLGDDGTALAAAGADVGGGGGAD